jgi:hypothetical protein
LRKFSDNRIKTPPFGQATAEKGEIFLKKQEEKKPVPWELADPKPPIVQSGRGENLRQYRAE